MSRHGVQGGGAAGQRRSGASILLAADSVSRCGAPLLVPPETGKCLRHRMTWAWTSSGCRDLDSSRRELKPEASYRPQCGHQGSVTVHLNGRITEEEVCHRNLGKTEATHAPSNRVQMQVTECVIVNAVPAAGLVTWSLRCKNWPQYQSAFDLWCLCKAIQVTQERGQETHLPGARLSELEQS